MEKIDFTFDYLRKELSAIQQRGYKFITCEEFVANKKSLNAKTVVLRIDIDIHIRKVPMMVSIFHELGIKGTFFLRLHAPDYNPFSFENYRIIKDVVANGNELGYHSEIVDQAYIWNEDAEKCLLRDIDLINRMFSVKIKGVASHGGITGLNNLDFWKNRKPQQYGLLYEGYDKEPAYNLFQEAFYISDSEWVRWKCYDKGVRREGDTRSPSQHAADNHPLIHLLIHPDTYYHQNIYE